MEKCVGSDYMQSKNVASETFDTSSSTSSTESCLSRNSEQKNECKGSCEISKVQKKIVSQERSHGQSEENITSEEEEENERKDEEKEETNKRKNISESKLNVLNKHMRETARQSVQKKTKIIKRNVPDRLGKYVSYSVRSETKLFLSECKINTKSASNERFLEDKDTVDVHTSEERSNMKILFDEYAETKLALIGNECLSNKEAVSLSNSFESDLETKNIFENFFDDCLGSTSKKKDASSQGNCSKIAGDKTPMKKILVPEKRIPGAPVKVKDHSSYYSSHKNIRHVCAYCQKIFKSNGKLNSHVYSHTGERPFDCNHCGKAFSSKFKLVRHLLIHSEIRKFVCQICDRTFLRNDHLKNHYKVHDPQKKMYKCPKENCDKEYSSVMSHKKHMAYHSVEDGDLKCLICNVKYETKEEVLFHLKSHSGSRLFKSQSDKKFKCEFCDRLFLTRKDVTRHLVVHTGERDFLCQFCPQRFGRKDHLVRHIKKSHGNEDLTVKNELEIRTKEEGKKKDEVKLKTNDRIVKKKDNAASITSNQTIPSTDFSTKETNTQTDEETKNKTHIVITVQGENTLRKRNNHENSSKKKSFQKNESLVPKKKQVPLTKCKNSTTQILLQNIPNILIIPNNSIILLRNQGTSKKEIETKTLEPEAVTRPTGNETISDNFLPVPQLLPQTTDNFNLNFNDFNSNIFPSSSQFLSNFPDSDNFCNFQPDITPFGSQFEDTGQLNFEMLNHSDMLPRPEVALSSSNQLTNGNLLTETSRQIKLLETGINTISSSDKLEREKNDTCEDLFEDGMLNESILNDFKDETSGILPSDNDVGILNNILNNQSNDNCGFELLRNLLTSDNPVLSPLPGFSQIFHNSNTNTNSS